MRQSTYSPNHTNDTLDYLHEHLYELIFSFGKTEGLGYTYPQTEDLLDNDNAENLSITEITTILNLRDAFNFLFTNWQYPVELGTVLDYNALIGGNDLEANAGYIRGDYKIRIEGVPGVLPDIYEDEAKQLIDNAYSKYPNPIDCAIYLVLIISKKQFCCNGNKRTSLMICNHILVHANSGYIFAPMYYDNDDGTMFDGDYIQTLLDYYNDRISLDEAMECMNSFLIPID